MKITEKIKLLTDELIAIHLTQGVQPSELADAAFEKNYRKIEIVNKNNLIRANVTFLDQDDGFASTVVTMRYTYNSSKKLMCIEQKIGQRQFKVQWDREQNVNRLIAELNDELSKLCNAVVVQEILSRLPNDLKCGINGRLQLAA